ncbi:hypothetical protein [Bdellovibrio sp. HCB337]|uniref:hypothetical protein n=1 Tax=Bdellovibrio sp. HCB337 TaxID=3394358 RepID=UPI0039A5999F
MKPLDLSILTLMKQLETKDLDHPRQVGRAAIEATLTKEEWQRNVAFTQELQKMINKHKLCRHPVIGLLNTEKLNKEISKVIHFEFSYAFAEIFTDSLIQAMITSSSLEKRLGPMGKVSSRFLLQLNLLDELGFKPKSNNADDDDYCGNPFQAHYLQFSETIEQLGGKSADVLNYKASTAAKAARASFTDNYGDHLTLTCVLAVAETVFSLFAGPWAKSVSLSTDIDVSKGYHKIHVEDDHGHFVDDDHSEDSWYIFRQAVQEKDFEDIRDKVSQWLDMWYDFGDQVIHIAQQINNKK